MENKQKIPKLRVWRNGNNANKGILCNQWTSEKDISDLVKLYKVLLSEIT